MIRLDVARLPSGAIRNRSGSGTPALAWTPLAWQAFLRRLDIEHTFRMLKHTLGWTARNSAHPHRLTAGPGSC
ncbi:hypothetical protein H4W33_000508 [Kibdelosporangium phytohabitans]|uniref:Transposase IS4-like domain-containing protein n=1 Tax=Kibdelosporangium phytohabitans TaxID=860235 RepID=A0A0N9HT61_9PSEU|nr:hypothetical protein AOZ06_29200 [Kibdelosporangium phytohabitans]MBE1461496.1 hypothetical protein [Kibdelosporangium phytohabitans]